MSLIGKWRITHMDRWSQKAIDLVSPGFVELSERGGQLHFIAVDGRLDCRHIQRNGRPYVDFTWDGNDECDHASGRGWAKLMKDGTVSGRIYIHQGDDSGFKAIPFSEAEKRSSSARRGAR